LKAEITIPATEATRAPKANGWIIMGIETPIPPANKKAPENNNPVIAANRKFPCDNQSPKYKNRNTRKQGTDKFPIVVKPYGANALDGKLIIEKFEDVRLSINLPNVVVGRGVMVFVGNIVIYGGDCAFTIPTMPSAHIIEIILEI
jgi:hypothetical protein